MIESILLPIRWGERQTKEIVPGVSRVWTEGTMKVEYADLPPSWQAIHALLGRVNGQKTGVYSPETLILTNFEVGWLEKNDERWGWRVTYHFRRSLTLGVCEDGVKRLVGWNRVYFPQFACWHDGLFRYAHAEDHGGFGRLLEGAKI